MRRRRTNRRLSAWPFLIALLAVLFIVFHAVKLEQDARVREAKYQALESLLTTQNRALQVKLAIATASGSSGQISETDVRGLVRILFPPSQVEHFMKILRCEDGTFDPRRTHINNDNSIDIGLAQINSAHRRQVEALFHQGFEAAMQDWVKNLTFASLIFQQQGNFSAWTCNRLIH